MFLSSSLRLKHFYFESCLEQTSNRRSEIQTQRLVPTWQAVFFFVEVLGVSNVAKKEGRLSTHPNVLVGPAGNPKSIYWEDDHH